jgi:hypothetical protein
MFTCGEGLRLGRPHERVHPVAAIQAEAFVIHRQRMLEEKLDAAPCEFVRQALFVGGFEQPRSQDAMHFDRAADHPIR